MARSQRHKREYQGVDSAGDTYTPGWTPVITSPVDGSTVTDPLYPISGSGCVPNREVQLWSSDRIGAGFPNAVTTADAEGAFIFDGDTPALVGTYKWAVISGGVLSPIITVTLTGVQEGEEGDGEVIDDQDLGMSVKVNPEEGQVILTGAYAARDFLLTVVYQINEDGTERVLEVPVAKGTSVAAAGALLKGALTGDNLSATSAAGIVTIYLEKAKSLDRLEANIA